MFSKRFLLVTLSLSAVKVECGDRIPERTCGTLFSLENFGGKAFALKDFDQSVILKKEYRHSLNGWPETGSIRVEDGCKLTVCSDTHFMGRCHSLTASNNSLNLLTSHTRSANCSCVRSCRCEDIVVPRDEYDNGFIGRAYLKGGCSTCNAKYIRLRKNEEFPQDDKNSVEAIVLASGCNLVVFSKPDNKGQMQVITGPVHKRFNGILGSYTFTCDNNTQLASVSPPVITDPPGIHLPLANSHAFFEMLHSNDNLSKHPGFQAALKSTHNRRSSRNAYVILVGNYLPYNYGFPQCKDSPSDKIGECRVPVSLDHLGVSAELRVITVPIGLDSIEDDYRLMAGLDEYMSTHEELKDSIPNAVIIWHWIHDENFAVISSIFQRRLQIVHTLRTLLVDENYSNVVFLLNYLNRLSTREQRQPAAKIAEFEEDINKYWAFPNPINICINSASEAHLHNVNGFVKMENEEYWPKNLEVMLDNICEKGGDTLGQAIFKAAFLDNHTPRYSAKVLVHDISADDAKIGQYRKFSAASTLQKTIWKKLSQLEWKMKAREIQHQLEIEGLKAELAVEKRSRLENAEQIKEQVWEKLQVDLKKLFE